MQKYQIVVELLNEKSTAAEDARRKAEELKNSANKLAFEAQGKLNSLRGSQVLLKFAISLYILKLAAY